MNKADTIWFVFHSYFSHFGTVYITLLLHPAISTSCYNITCLSAAIAGLVLEFPLKYEASAL